MINTERPWQGTLLGIIGSLFLSTMLLVAVLLVIAQEFFSSIFSQFITAETMWIEIALKQGIFILASFLLLISIFFFFIVRGIFQGKKWTIVSFLIITSLALLSGFSNLHHGNIINLFLNAGILSLEIMCLKHPFYRKERL